MGTRSPVKFDKIIPEFVLPLCPASVSRNVQLRKHASSSVLHSSIDKSGTEVCQNSLDQDLTYDKSSCLTTVRVEKDEQVFFRQKFGGVTCDVLSRVTLCLRTSEVNQVSSWDIGAWIWQTGFGRQENGQPHGPSP